MSVGKGLTKGVALGFLLLLSHIGDARTTIETVTRDASHRNLEVETSQDQLPKERINVNLVAYGKWLALMLSLPTLLFFFIGLRVAYTVYAYDEKQPRPEPQLGRAIVSVGILASLATAWTIFFMVTKPKSCKKEGEKCTNNEFYLWMHILALSLTSIVLLISMFMMIARAPSRATALTGHFFTVFSLVVGVVVQVWLGSVMGEWHLHGTPDHTISSSMDYVPGSVLSGLILAPMTALIPLFESLFVEDGDTFQRGVRVVLAAFAAVGVLLVIITPLETQGVSEETSKTWKKWHAPVAAIAFGFLSLYLVSVAASSLYHHGASFFVILGLVVLLSGMILLATTNGAKTTIQKHLFSAGEYLCLLAVPLIGLSRYAANDFTSIQTALIKYQT